MLFYAVILCVIIQWAYWIFIYARLIFYKESVSTDLANISIVISIKNELKNLPRLAAFLQNQQYPKHEILFVDDFSTDESWPFLEKQGGFKLLKAKEDLPGKKHALEEGIKEASYDNILVTDGDCYGISPHWIRTMAAAKTNHKIVLAYAPLVYNSLIGFFAAFETWIIAMQYLSYARAGIPYMGVGRNMLFDKSLFIEKGGYGDHKDLASGDDDLLIRDLADGRNTTVTLNPSSKMFSPAPENLFSFIRQKRRHLSTSGRYKALHQALLALWALSLIGFYLLLILYGWISGNWLMAGTIWLIKIVIPWGISIPIGIKMDETRFLFLFPILDVVLAFYYWVMVPFTFIKKKNDWN